MPVFAALIVSLFGGVANFVAEYFTRRVAVAAALLVVCATVTAAFVAAVQALIAGITTAAPSELSLAASWFVPSNMDDCIAAIAAGHTLRWAYDWQIKAAFTRAG